MTTTPLPRPCCPVCTQYLNLLPLPKPGGRRRIYCSNRCRQRAYRLRKAKRDLAAPLHNPRKEAE